MGWSDSGSPPYPAEVSHELGLELGTLVHMYLLGEPEVPEYILVQGSGHRWGRCVWNSQSICQPGKVVREHQYPGVPSGG